MITETISCPRCEREGLTRDDFYKHKNRANGLHLRCKKCVCELSQAWRRDNPKRNRLRARRINYRTKYGITIDEYEAMRVAQGYVCAGCGEPCRSGRQLCVDHDHDTGKVRGLLCLACNRAVGLVQDNPQTLHSLAQYLEESK